MNIGQAAALCEVSAKMVRHDEQLGLLNPVARSGAGYRLYGPAEVNTLRFIRRARDLGFSMAWIAESLELWQNRRRASVDVKRIAQAHVADLDRRIAEMAGMRRRLEALVHGCHGNDRPDCPILDGLAESGPSSIGPGCSSRQHLQGAGPPDRRPTHGPDTAFARSTSR